MKLPPLKVGINVWDARGRDWGEVLEIRHQPGSGNIWEVKVKNSRNWMLAHQLLPYDPRPEKVMDRPLSRLVSGAQLIKYQGSLYRKIDEKG